MRLPLLLYPNETLAYTSDEVEVEWARSQEFGALLDSMVETMVWFRGVGLSAIQVGVPERVFVMRTKKEVLKIVNPVIESFQDSEPVEVEEGCLSVPGVYERVLRYPEVELSCLDVVSGERKHYLMEGVEAQCVQHEMEHLDGKMYTDGYGPVKRDIVRRKVQKQIRLNPLFQELR